MKNLCNASREAALLENQNDFGGSALTPLINWRNGILQEVVV